MNIIHTLPWAADCFSGGAVPQSVTPISRAKWVALEARVLDLGQREPQHRRNARVLVQLLAACMHAGEHVGDPAVGLHFFDQRDERLSAPANSKCVRLIP